MTPSVSVVIPAYGVAPFIGETLESLFEQTYQDFEAIVVDDGSKDGLEEALAPYRARIRYIRRDNGGLSAARNTGLAHARGRFIALLDGDDLWMPRFLEVLVTGLEQDASLGLIYPNATYFGVSTLAGRLHQDVYPSTAPVTFDRLIARQCHVFGSLVFRRSVLDQVGVFDEALRGGVEDFDMWLRMAQAGVRLAFTTEMLVMYRRRADAMSKDASTMLLNQIRVLDKALSRDVSADQRRAIEARRGQVSADLNVAMAKRMIRTGDAAAALGYIRAANVYLQTRKLRFAGVALALLPWIGVRALRLIDTVTSR